MQAAWHGAAAAPCVDKLSCAIPNAMHPSCTPTCATIWLSSAEPTSPGPMMPTATFCMVGMRGGMQMLSRGCGLGVWCCNAGYESRPIFSYAISRGLFA